MLQIPPAMQRRAASLVEDRVVYEPLAAAEQAPPSLEKTPKPFQREVSPTDRLSSGSRVVPLVTMPVATVGCWSVQAKNSRSSKHLCLDSSVDTAVLLDGLRRKRCGSRRNARFVSVVGLRPG